MSRLSPCFRLKAMFLRSLVKLTSETEARTSGKAACASPFQRVAV